MSRSDRPLPVVFATAALRDLHQIFDWNQKTYGAPHAYNYVEFLVARIEEIGKKPTKGKVVDQRNDLRYQVIRRGKKGHGHVAVYRLEESLITVIHIFHTAQDWPTKLAEEP